MATICETKKADYKNALFYYQMAMEMDFPDAIERMAEAYLGDELGLEKDEKTALKLFKRAAKLGNAAENTIRSLWNEKETAKRLINTCENLLKDNGSGNIFLYEDGPMSKAPEL